MIVLLIALAASACHKKAPPATAPAQPPSATPAPPGPPSCTLTGEPATVAQGQSVTLSWSTKDATSLDIQPALGKQLAEGSTAVTPQESTTYILTATGPGGTATCTARVTVEAPSPPPTPSVREEALGQEARVAQVKDVFFDYDKADLRADAQETLTGDAAVLKAHPDVQFTVEGHCDERGSEEYNLGLGQRRAGAAKAFLVSLGVSPNQLSTISYGKDRPFCTESSESCWQQNRRAHFVPKRG